jgi:hypothetical protein
MFSYRYIGAINTIGCEINDFVLSIYSDENGDSYIHELDSDNRIVNFIKYSSADDNPLIPPKSKDNFQICKNDFAIYSFLLEDNTLIYGNYESIVKQLQPFLDNEEFNIMSRINIACFLKERFKTVELISMAELKYANKNINVSLPPSTFLGCDMKNEISKEDINQLIQLNGSEKNIKNLLIFKGNYVYCFNHQYKLHSFLKDEIIGQEIKKLVNSCLIVALDKGFLETPPSDYLKTNPDIYYFMLTNERVLPQNAIDSVASIYYTINKVPEVSLMENLISTEYDLMSMTENKINKNVTDEQKRKLQSEARKIQSLAKQNMQIA